MKARFGAGDPWAAAQSAGSWPPAEIGLMGIDYWSSQFHMEMTWWHLAHFGLWDRRSLADCSMGCYQKFLPLARELARPFDYAGATWDKQVGSETRSRATPHKQRDLCCVAGSSQHPGDGACGCHRGLRHAAAIMAAGWDGGPTRHAPGFPANGSWIVKWEGLKRAP